MLNINDIRKEFSAHLSSQPAARFSMDAALMHVVQIAYQTGLNDAKAEPAVPPAPTCEASL